MSKKTPEKCCPRFVLYVSACPDPLHHDLSNAFIKCENNC